MTRERRQTLITLKNALLNSSIEEINIYKESLIDSWKYAIETENDKFLKIINERLAILSYVMIVRNINC